MRDDFTVPVKKLLAERVSFRCSNPDCNRSTIGPASEPGRSVSIGEAAHITAAAPRGPRYDSQLSHAERKNSANGIWLCETCAKLVDADRTYYTENLLRTWKRLAEERASESIRKLTVAANEQGGSAAFNQLVSSYDRLAERLSEAIELRLALAREASREGRTGDALNALREIKADDTHWTALTPSAKARVLLMEARLVMSNDVPRAKQLADEAHSLAAVRDEIRTRALITCNAGDPAEAFHMLQRQDDSDSLLLRAIILLNLGRLEECRQTLDLLNHETESDPDALRIQALLMLLDGDVYQAQVSIRRALDAKPHWEAIQFSAGVIWYYSALSPALLPPYTPEWPEPTFPMLIKEDDTSVGLLRLATDVFRSLVSKPGRADAERRGMEIWLLACLANDPERQREAIDLCRKLLAEDPVDYRAIFWAGARHWPIDLSENDRALEVLVREGSAAVHHVLALASRLLDSGQAANAAQLIASTKPIFERQQAESLWTLWRSRTLTAAGEFDEALRAIEGYESTPEAIDAYTAVLDARARQTGDWGPLVEHLGRSYEQIGDPLTLLGLCQLKMQQGQWAYVADRAEQLLDDFGTSAVLGLAAQAAFNAHHFESCRNLLAGGQAMFRHGRLPYELRRLLVLALMNLGLFSNAVAEADALVRDQPTAEHLLLLGDVQYSKGDLKGLARSARRLSQSSDSAPEQVLHMTRLVYLDDRETARALWRKAQSAGIPDALAGEALILGFQLGLDSEVAPLMPNLDALATRGEGGLHKGTLADLKAVILDRREHQAKAWEMYQAGRLPIHLVARSLDLPLAGLYHGGPLHNENTPDPLRQFPLYIRHGGRALTVGLAEAKPMWSLNVDLTGILLAEHLEVLTQVQEVYAPIRIPPDLVGALLHLRERVAHPQPRRLANCRLIIELVDRGMLYVTDPSSTLLDQLPPQAAELGSDWAALLALARAGGGYLLDFVSHIHEARDRLDKEFDSLSPLIGCRNLADSLHQSGPLSEDQHRQALTSLGTESVPCSEGNALIQERPLYCYANTPDVLADANLLRAACRRFHVVIEQRELEQMRATLWYFEHDASATSLWLTNLITRISDGLDAGIYQIIGEPGAAEALEGDLNADPVYRSLGTLFKFAPREHDVLWADDRWTNGYLRRDTLPILGISEVLRSLVSAKALSLTDYYRRLHRLRAGNARFIPLEPGEIVYHLRQAAVCGASVAETEELMVLRRYVAACLLQASVLQRPPLWEGAPNQHGEIEFVFGLRRAVSSALAEIWKAGEDETATQARAEWLMEHLYLDYQVMLDLGGWTSGDQDETYMLGISLADLISQAYALDHKPNGTGPGLRHRYLKWLSDSVLEPRFDANPGLLTVCANILKETIRQIQEEASSERLAAAIGITMHEFHQDLPQTVRDVLEQDIGFMQSILYHFATAATVGDLSFPLTDYFRAAGAAINGREGPLNPVDSETEIVFRPVEGKRGAFIFEHPDTQSPVLVSDDVLELLAESPDRRRAALYRNRGWFDSQGEALDQAVSAILSLEDPVGRVEAARSWRESSASEHYQALYRRLCDREPYTAEDLLPPSAAGLLRFHRLSPASEMDQPFAAVLSTAAHQLLEAEGLGTALRRCMGIPVAIPSVLVQAFRDKSPDDRRSLVRQLVSSSGSPLSRIHLVRLLLASASETPAFGRLARKIIVGLLAPTAEEQSGALLNILRWTSEEFSRRPDTASWPVSCRLSLSWAHAHELYAIFTAAGAPAGALRAEFEGASHRMPSGIFEREGDFWFDIAHPRLVNHTTLVISGLSYVLQDAPPGFVTPNLMAQFIASVFTEVDGVPRLRLPLYADPLLAHNALGSFLSADRREQLTALLPDPAAEPLTRLSLHAVAAQAVAAVIEDTENGVGWVNLLAVIGDLPPYADLLETLQVALTSTSYSALLQADFNLGNLALHVATQQAQHLGDDAQREHLAEELVACASILADQGSAHLGSIDSLQGQVNAPQQLQVLFLEFALNLAVSRTKGADASAHFASLLSQVVDVWPATAHTYLPIIQLLCKELPISVCRPLWRLLVRTRAG